MDVKKINILFVDDEELVIKGIRRMFFSMKSRWNMYFAYSGEKALDIMKDNEIDIVITDMRMPQMSGAQLLNIIKKNYPHVIRIILSGHSDEDMISQTTLSAHQFLAKPIKAEMLKNKITKAVLYSKLLNSKVLLKEIVGKGNLPSLPRLYLELEEELKKEDFSISSVSQIISKDIGMTAKIIQLVNSAFFGLSTKITDITSAISYLGIDTVKSLVLHIKLFQDKNMPQSDQTFLENIITHSMNVASISKELAIKLGQDEQDVDDAYLSGILHDIGKIVLIKIPNYTSDISKFMKEDNFSFIKAEQQIFGSTHCEVGAYLLGLWGFADHLIDAVVYHHHDYIIEDAEYDLSKILCIANILSSVEKFDLKDIKSLELTNGMIDLNNFVKYYLDKDE